MAKITAEFDTVTKKLVVAMDGVPFENVNSVSFYNYYGDDEDDAKFYMEVSTREASEEGDMVKYTKVCAKDNGEAEVTERVTNDLTERLSKAIFQRR